jgi:hypothetical protein
VASVAQVGSRIGLVRFKVGCFFRKFFRFGFGGVVPGVASISVRFEVGSFFRKLFLVGFDGVVPGSLQ